MMTRVVNKVHIFKEQVLQRNRRLGGQLEAKEIIIGSKLLMILIQRETAPGDFQRQRPLRLPAMPMMSQHMGG